MRIRESSEATPHMAMIHSSLELLSTSLEIGIYLDPYSSSHREPYLDNTPPSESGASCVSPARTLANG
jgi:hypothetical protein